MPEVKHHRSGTTWSVEVRAKISTSMVVDKDTDPELWDRLFGVNLERLKILQEIHAKAKAE